MLTNNFVKWNKNKMLSMYLGVFVIFLNYIYIFFFFFFFIFFYFFFIFFLVVKLGLIRKAETPFFFNA